MRRAAWHDEAAPYILSPGPPHLPQVAADHTGRCRGHRARAGGVGVVPGCVVRGVAGGIVVQFVVAGGDVFRVIGVRAIEGEAPLLMTWRSSMAMEYCGSSASARSSATLASAPLPDCQAMKTRSRQTQVMARGDVGDGILVAIAEA